MRPAKPRRWSSSSVSPCLRRWSYVSPSPSAPGMGRRTQVAPARRWYRASCPRPYPARGEGGAHIDAGTIVVRLEAAHIMWSSACFSSWTRSADSSTTGLLLVFFHQCCTPTFSTETSPILCSIETEQLLVYSLIVPETT